MKSNSAKRLDQLMHHFGINQSDMVKKTGIPKSAISMYLSGQRIPRQNRLSDIAEAYGVNEAWLMGYDVPMKRSEHISTKNKESCLSEGDMKLLSDYQALDTQGQNTVQFIMNNELRRVKRQLELERQIVEITEQLEKTIPTRVWAYHGKIAAAGTGVEFADMIAGTKEYPITDENRNADYTIGVSGDSMEPEYYDGDVVFVKKTTHLSVGDIGIFQKDNGIYIKKVGENSLISLNPQYAPLIDNGDIRCLGKVIAKAE